MCIGNWDATSVSATLFVKETLKKGHNYNVICKSVCHRTRINMHEQYKLFEKQLCAKQSYSFHIYVTDRSIIIESNKYNAHLYYYWELSHE